MNRLRSVFVLVAVFLAAPILAAAQSSPTVYTYVAEWQVDRAHWADFVQMFEQRDQPVLDRLLDDGTIVEYGFDATVVHSVDGYTHSMWWVSPKVGNLEKVLTAFEEAGNASDMSYADQMKAIAGSVKRHQDAILSSIDYNMKAGSHPGSYFLLTTLTVKEGQNTRFNEVYKSFFTPLYKELMDQGQVLGYGMDQQWIHQAPVNTRYVWVVVSGPDAITAMEDAFNAKMQGMDSTSRAGIRAIFGQVTEPNHRDDMTRLIHSRVK
jgi:hypothetical protein